MASTSSSVESSASASVESSASASVESKVVVLKSSDGETFEVEEKVIIQSETIKHMIEDIGTDTAMPVPNVDGKILAKVIEYCNKHVDDGAEVKNDDNDKNEEKKIFDTDFVKVEKTVLFDLTLAANYLNIKSLLDLTCQTIADKIKNMTVEEVREEFNIKNDFTPEEEEQARKENAWAFE